VILSEQADLAGELLDANEEGIVIVDLQGNVLSVNHSALQRYGKPANAIVGANIWSFYSATTINYHKILFNQTIKTARSITTVQREKDRWIKTTIYPFIRERKGVVAIAFYTCDISLQIEAQEALKRVTLELVTAQEEERHRISRDLHDDIGQRMTALILQLRSIKEAIETGQEGVVEEVNSSLLNVETITKHIRQIFYQLYPPSLNRMALPKVLAAFCSSIEEANRLRVDFSSQEQIPELTERQATVIYRFVQEGLTNVAKHARATAVWVNMDYTGGDLNISVEDNGQGFELENAPNGMGLHGIRERFLALGGSFEVESALGKGTRLSGTIPIDSGTIQEKT